MMSWENLLRRVMRPVGSWQPHNTSEYGAIRKRGTSPHEGVDANYNVGPNGQTGINLQHPALRAPVDGIVTNAGEGTVGRIAIRDANGLSHEILHTHTRHVRKGDPVVAGQLIGTMGNMGVLSKGIESGDHHVHFQIRDSAGNVINPKAYWNQQSYVDPEPTPPTFLDEHQRYLRRVDEIAGNAVAAPRGADASVPFGTGGQFVPGSATSSRPLYETRSFSAPSEEAGPANAGKEIRRLVRMPTRTQDLAGFDPNAPVPPPNQIPPADRPVSFDDRFGNWSSSSGVSAPLAPNQPVAPPPQAGRPLGLLTGKPMPDHPFPPTIFGFPGRSISPGEEDWAWALVPRAEWDKKAR
jgi:hypothetical protein